MGASLWLGCGQLRLWPGVLDETMFESQGECGQPDELQVRQFAVREASNDGQRRLRRIVDSCRQQIEICLLRKTCSGELRRGLCSRDVDCSECSFTQPRLGGEEFDPDARLASAYGGPQRAGRR
eukprot:2569588-Pleurochrysis_carterae.AAC.1